MIKLRGMAGEPQTHAEKYPFDVLLQELRDRVSPQALPANLVVETGPMIEHLERAVGLVTVSSTAAIEAAAIGVPVLALDDFGTSAQLINLVFEGSNLLAGSDRLIAGEFRRPEPRWLDENYFHEAGDENWIAGIENLVGRRNRGELPLRPQFKGRFGGRLRHVWDRKLALGDLDTTLSGAVANAIGQPVRWLMVLSRAPIRARRRRDARRRREAIEHEVSIAAGAAAHASDTAAPANDTVSS